MTNTTLKLLSAAIVTLLPANAHADTADRLLQLIAIPGVSGYEHQVRSAIEMMLPAGARVRADNLGNIVIRTGNGIPHTLIVAPLDESGLVVSAITDEGYLRVHRHTTAPAARVATQFLIGQPVEIVTASGTPRAGRHRDPVHAPAGTARPAGRGQAQDPRRYLD